MTSTLKDAVQGRLEEYFSFYEDIVNMESYTPDKEAVDELGGFIRDFAIRHGFDVQTHPFAKAGDGYLVSINKEASPPPFVFTGHLDTVFPAGTWEKPLFRRNGNIITGPGVYDMKGGLVIGFLTMQVLKDISYSDREVRFILVPDEELSEGLSGEEGKDFIRDNARGAVAAVTLEGSSGTYITVGRKASIRYSVHVHGKCAHAGGHYAEGISAIKEAARQILAIEEASDPEQITYNCGLIKGGISPNTVPGECEYLLYNRYWRLEQRQIVKDHVESILGKSFIKGAHTDFKVIGERLPMDDSPQNYALAEYLNNVAGEIGLPTRSPYREPAGSDASYTAQVGTPSVCSMGPVGFGAHQMDEMVYADSIEKQSIWLAEAVIRLKDDLCLKV